jgi:hypothetical protein
MGTIPSSVPVGAVFRRHECGGGIQVQVGQNDPRHRSSVVEHTLGKGEVTGSSPVGGLEQTCCRGWSVAVPRVARR